MSAFKDFVISSLSDNQRYPLIVNNSRFIKTLEFVEKERSKWGKQQLGMILCLLSLAYADACREELGVDIDRKTFLLKLSDQYIFEKAMALMIYESYCKREVECSVQK